MASKVSNSSNWPQQKLPQCFIPFFNYRSTLKAQTKKGEPAVMDYIWGIVWNAIFIKLTSRLVNTFVEDVTVYSTANHIEFIVTLQ